MPRTATDRCPTSPDGTAFTHVAIDTPYHAAVHADRGVYRPGDTAHVVAIVRDAKEKAPDPALPLAVQVIDPRAKVVRKTTLKTNGSGVIALDHELPAFADTGHWRVQLAVGDKPLASYSVQVEEFVSAPMPVRTTLESGSTTSMPQIFDVFSP